MAVRSKARIRSKIQALKRAYLHNFCTATAARVQPRAGGEHNAPARQNPAPEALGIGWRGRSKVEICRLANNPTEESGFQEIAWN